MSADVQKSFRSPRWRTLVYVGAGDGSSIDEAEISELEHITLVEPHPDLAESLAERFKGKKSVKLLRAAVCPGGQPASLTLFNLAELSSLKTPTGITELFPGLRSIGQAAVETISLKSLIDLHIGAGKKPAALVLDAPGVEKDILLDAGHEALQSFEEIVVFAGERPLYQGAGTADEISKLLSDARFELVARTSDELGRIRLTFFNNRKLLELEKALANANASKEKAENETAELKTRREELKAERDKLRNERDEAKKAREKLEARLQELEAAVETSAKETKGLKAETKQLADKLASSEAEGDERRARNKALEEEVVRMEAQLQLISELMGKDRHGAKKQ
ncbi:hypothetical protein [Glycocaulis sp.]